MSCKKFAFGLIACLLIATTAYAVEVTMDKVHFLGKGIVVNPSEATDFKLLKVIVATIDIPEFDETIGVGLFVLDDKKYKVRDITIDKTSASGDVYEDKTVVGDFALTKIEKADTEIWAGGLTISGTKYYMYLLGAPRHFSPQESGDKIEQFCRANPDKCAGASKEICEQPNPPQACLNAMIQYCAENQDDMRCRGEMRGHCADNPNAPECRPPSMRCMECIQPVLVECGYTVDVATAMKCYEEGRAGGMPASPECQTIGPPTAEQEQCIGQKMSTGTICRTECAEMQGRAPQQGQRGPEGQYGPGGEGGYGAGPVNSMCRKVMVEECQAISTIAPTGPMNCYDAVGKECAYRCADNNGKIDEGCNFKCKMEGQEKCKQSEPLQEMGIAMTPCVSPYVCMRADNPDMLRQQGYEMVGGFMCPQREFCVKQTGTSGSGGGYACPSYYDPVCGTDGRTYPNPCHAKAANVEIKSSGECGGATYPTAKCGNGMCEGPTETMSSCPSDCGGGTANACPDGTPKGNCVSTKVGAYCSFEGYIKPNCGKCGCPSGMTCEPNGYMCISADQAYCGDRICQGSETSMSCPTDCGGGGPTLKQIGESCTYPSDCQSMYCVNGVCSATGANKPLGSPCMNTGECMSPYICISSVCSVSSGYGQGTQGLGAPCTSTSNCMSPYTCISGICSSSGGGGGYCGDGMCNNAETMSSCPSDCGSAGYCGNGVCQYPETMSSCPSDCGGGGYCGDTICQSSETSSSCPSDCGGGGLKQIGESCTYPSDCQSMYCVNGVCSATGANKPLGSPCMNTGECMSPYTCISGICSVPG